MSAIVLPFPVLPKRCGAGMNEDVKLSRISLFSHVKITPERKAMLREAAMGARSIKAESAAQYQLARGLERHGLLIRKARLRYFVLSAAGVEYVRAAEAMGW